MTRDRAIEILQDDASGASLFEVATAVDMAIEALKERPHGEWVYEPNLKSCTIGWFWCSYCGFKNDSHRNYNFCPICGADMREGKAE